MLSKYVKQKRHIKIVTNLYALSTSLIFAMS